MVPYRRHGRTSCGWPCERKQPRQKGEPHGGQSEQRYTAEDRKDNSVWQFEAEYGPRPDASTNANSAGHDDANRSAEEIGRGYARAKRDARADHLR